MTEETKRSGSVPLQQEQPANLDELMLQAAHRISLADRHHRIEQTGPGPFDIRVTPLWPTPEKETNA